MGRFGAAVCNPPDDYVSPTALVNVAIIGTVIVGIVVAILAIRKYR